MSMASFPKISNGNELDKDLFPQVIFNSEKKYSKSNVLTDSNYLFISSDNSVEIFDRKNKFKKIMTLVCHTSTITSVFTDRNFLYTASRDHTTKIWDKKNNFSLLKTLHSSSAIYYLTVDNYYIYGSNNGKIIIWDISANFKFITTLDCPEITSITALYSDNTFLYVGSDQRIFQIWNIKEKFTFVTSLPGCEITEEIEKYLVPGEDETEMVLSFTSDDNFLYSGSGDGIIKVWDRNNNFNLIRVFERAGVIRNLQCFSRYLLCSSGIQIKIWDRTNDFKLITSIECPSPENDNKYYFELIQSLAIDDTYIYISLTQGNFQLYESNHPFNLVSYSPNNRKDYFIFKYCDSHYIFGYEPFSSVITIYEYNPIFKLVGNVDFEVKIKTPFPYHPTFRNIVLGIYTTKQNIYVYYKRVLKIFTKGPDFQMIKVIDINDLIIKEEDITAVFVDENYLYIGFSSIFVGSIGIYDVLRNFEYITILKGPTSIINVICSNKNYIFSGCGNPRYGDIMIWDLRNKFQLVKTHKRASSYPTSLNSIENLINPNIKTLYVDPHVESDYLIPWIFRHDGGIHCMYVDENYLFAGTVDKFIMVFDLNNGFSFITVLKGHTSKVEILMSSDGILYSGSESEIIKWDIKDVYNIKVIQKEIGRSYRELEGFSRSLYTSYQKEDFLYCWEPSEGIILSRRVKSIQSPNILIKSSFGKCIEEMINNELVVKIIHS